MGEHLYGGFIYVILHTVAVLKKKFRQITHINFIVMNASMSSVILSSIFIQKKAAFVDHIWRRFSDRLSVNWAS